MASERVPLSTMPVGVSNVELRSVYLAAEADLHIDATYGSLGSLIAGDPLQRMFHCGNQGGFRQKRNPITQRLNLVVLFSGLSRTRTGQTAWMNRRGSSPTTVTTSARATFTAPSATAT